MKRLALVLVFLLCVVCAAAACGEVSGDYEYTVLPDGTVEITNYTGMARTLTIPAQLDGRTVTSIGRYAFSSGYSLTDITIPDSVTSIGDYAFDQCEFLTDMTIPDSVTTIGDYAFRYCR